MTRRSSASCCRRASEIFDTEAKDQRNVKTTRVVLVMLTLALVCAQTALAQVNPFGDSLDLKESDIAMLQAAASALFQNEKAQIGQTESWKNPKTGNSGAVSLVELFEHAGMPCKRLQHSIKQKGHADLITYQFARCRTGDGSWKLL